MLVAQCSCRAVLLWMMMATMAHRSVRAYTCHSSFFFRQLQHTRTVHTRGAALLSTLSSNDTEKLEAQIRSKGDEIRKLKAAGIEKPELAPHIEELLALKSQLPQEEGEVMQEKKKNPAKNKEKRKGGTAKKAAEDMSESELRLNRLSKIEAMREAGVEPFEYTFSSTHTAEQLLMLYDEKLANGEEDEEADVSIAGRVMTRRVFGKLAFFTLQDETNSIQLQFDKNRLGDSFKVRLFVPLQ